MQYAIVAVEDAKARLEAAWVECENVWRDAQAASFFENVHAPAIKSAEALGVIFAELDAALDSASYADGGIDDWEEGRDE